MGTHTRGVYTFAAFRRATLYGARGDLACPSSAAALDSRPDTLEAVVANSAASVPARNWNPTRGGGGHRARPQHPRKVRGTCRARSTHAGSVAGVGRTRTQHTRAGSGARVGRTRTQHTRAGSGARVGRTRTQHTCRLRGRGRVHTHAEGVGYGSTCAAATAWWHGNCRDDDVLVCGRVAVRATDSTAPPSRHTQTRRAVRGVTCSSAWSYLQSLPDAGQHAAHGIRRTITHNIAR